MRGFGWMFGAVGLVLAGISAKAISDPTSPIGWVNWTDNPWSQGIIVWSHPGRRGHRLVNRLIANGMVSARTNQQLARVLWTLGGGAGGFLVFVPLFVPRDCCRS
jgi:hypothetical protein